MLSVVVTTLVIGAGPKPQLLAIAVVAFAVIARLVPSVLAVGALGPPAVRSRAPPPLRAALQGLNHPRQIVDRQPEGTGASAALPDAENRYSSVGIPAQPHTPGVAPDVEKDLAEARQRRCVGRGHEAYGVLNPEICPVNDH
jgi:hypothetical protein